MRLSLSDDDVSSRPSSKKPSVYTEAPIPPTDQLSLDESSTQQFPRPTSTTISLPTASAATASSLPSSPPESPTGHNGALQKVAGDQVVAKKRIKLSHKAESCDQCSKIDLVNMFDKADRHFCESGVNKRSMPRTESSKEGYFVATFQRSLSQSSACATCRFFWTMRVARDDSANYELRAFSSITCSGFINSNHLGGQEIITSQNAFLAVVPTQGLSKPYEAFKVPGVIYRSVSSTSSANAEANGIWGREIGQQIDFTVVKQWLRFCSTHHRGHCLKGKSGSKSILRGFRVINCITETPKVEVVSPDQNYVALSYVWGQDCGPIAWPKVVLDAIEVTKALGFQYLWVDRYCINQNHKEEKNYLISKMAWIYEAAEVTIIAAAGSDANHGLPGVGTSPRSVQPKIEVSGMTLVSTLPDPKNHIRKSKWSTRGWTYQEGVLSRRRLVFLDDQVFWECDGMVTHETIQLPLPSVHTRNMIRMGPFMQAGVFNGKPDEFSSFQTKGIDNKKRGAEVVEHVSNFTRRDLSYDTDSLFAFSGISDRYSDGNSGLGFILGLPVLMTDFGHRCNVSFGLALSSWIHDHDAGTPRRLSHLPSWTWAGWKGAVVWGWPGKPYFPKQLHYRWHLDLLLSRKNVEDIDGPDILITSSKGKAISLSHSLAAFPSAMAGDMGHVLQIENPLTLKKCILLQSGEDTTSTPVWMVNGFEARISMSVPDF